MCAAHSLNAVYCRGARPVYALNVPYSANRGGEVPAAVLAGAREVCEAAGVNVAGTEGMEDVEAR